MTSCKALIVRTLPNNQSKLSRNYDNQPVPFFTNDAIRYVNELGIMHLLVDIPSIDKPNDGGRLGNHRLFLIMEIPFLNYYIFDNLLDGFGFLRIQIQTGI